VSIFDNKQMNFFRSSLLLITIAFLAGGCGEPERPQSAAVTRKVSRISGDFDGVGKVSLFQGESCTSQIMFVFHRAGSGSISMAAPFRVSRLLTDAANDHTTVHVTGQWRRGKAAGCNYVEATEAEVQKSIW